MLIGVQKGVLDSLVDQKLLLQEAKRLNLDAKPEEVQRRLLQVPTLNPNGKWVGQELYTRFCQQMGYSSPSEFEDELTRIHDALCGLGNFANVWCHHRRTCAHWLMTTSDSD